MQRGRAEADPAFKQPIGYAIIVNPALRRVFAYQRASHQSRYDEERLMGRWSWGVGGHIEPPDTTGGNPIHESLKRELAEEVGLAGDLTATVLGYINDETTEVGSVHFGILYAVATDVGELHPVSAEIAGGRMRSLAEIEDLLDDPGAEVEEWSRIAFPPLKEHLYSL